MDLVNAGLASIRRSRVLQWVTGGRLPEELAGLKARLAVPLTEHLASLAGEGDLPARPASTLEFVVLGPAHEACRRYLAGAPVNLAGLRGLLPDVAWAPVSAFAAVPPARKPAARRAEADH